ncbi:MAG: DUF169 domain-containing protein [Candidatus Omnitrophica bacterium]|nr:DUF169 domain-containing protein [Candidatus Omnitrophota bacterium]
MDKVNQRFSNRFGSHWIKVKFYREKPKDDAKRLKDVRFCEATREAILYPILLDKESITCPGARHAFGWQPLFKNELLKGCRDKQGIKEGTLKSMISRAPYFKKPFKYIGLNTGGVPDMVLSYIPPREVMGLIKRYHNKEGGNLDVSLCTIMAVCGNVAVRTYLEEKISLSFGCEDSRKLANMGREYVAVGVPRKLFNLFVD